MVTKNLPVSPRFTPYNFLSRCKFSTLTTRQPMVEFYLLTFPRFPLRKKEHKSYFGKNRTHDFRTSRCAGYLLDHSGDEDCYPFTLLLNLSPVCGSCTPSRDSLSVALEITEDLPPQSVLDRWVGEPVKAVIVPTRVFLTNRKGFPTLSRRHQDFVTAMIK